MADYKRMVSYMYQYDNGVKKKNVGFARVESRNGQCKITLHMQLLGQLDSIFPTYLILRDDNIELIYVGDTTLKSQVMDSKLLFQTDNVANSGHSLSEMGGLLLFLNDNVFFATEWDDRPIVAKEVLDALKPKETRKPSKGMTRQEKIKNSDQVSDSAQDMPDEFSQEAKEIGAFDSLEEKAEEIEITSKEVKTEETKTELKEIKAEETELALKEVKAEEKALALREVTKETKKSPEELPSAEAKTSSEYEVDLLEELSLPKYKLPRGWKTIERLQNPYLKAENMDNPKIVTSSEISEKIGQAMESEKEETGEAALKEPAGGEENVFHELKASDKIESESIETYFENREREEAKVQAPLPDQSPECGMREDADSDSPTAESFFENHPRIYPFEDNEILLCVKIEPKDIGLLPKELWALSNNSFLLHGYYCYHHLIFAKKKESCKHSYILGVPGIYHNREQFMARMFGFENFKTIRKREAKMGDFGYWYLFVNL